MRIYSNFIPQERFDRRLGSFEKFKNKPITIFNDYVANEHQLSENPINILLINEPNEFFGLHDYAIQYGHQFNIILGWDEQIGKYNDNFILFPHGERNIDIGYIQDFAFKEHIFEVNFLCGVLNKIEGHHLRHKIYKKEDQIKIPHKWWYVLSDFDFEKNNRPDGQDQLNGNPIEGEGKKEVWNRCSMFHVAVENSKHPNYHTDKIVDAFSTKTLPIYWGDPNIGDWYDERGIITFEDENELVEIINNLTPEDYYNRLEYINKNYEQAKSEGNYFGRLEKFLDELIILNNL